MGLCRVGLWTKESWWEQKEFEENLMGTKGIWWELDENKRILMGYWWEQRNLMRTVWELDENTRILMGYWWDKRNLMGTVWEHYDFDGLLMGPKEIWWELHGNNGNLMKTQAPTLLNFFKNVPWGHPIGCPHMLYPKVLFRDELLRTGAGFRV